MRILHLIPALSGGGAERQLSYLAPALAAAGHEVHVAYAKAGPGNPELTGVVRHQLRRRSNYSPWWLWDLYGIMMRIRPQVVQTWISQMDVFGGVSARLAGIPCVFREPSSALAYPGTWKNGLRVAIGATASAVISNSRGGDDYWAQHVPFNRRHVVPNALALAEIDAASPQWPAGLERFASPMVLYVGRLASDMTARKNLRIFLQAIRRARQQREIVGVICGDGPQRCELEQLRCELGLDGAVHFTGYLPARSVWGLIKHAAMFVSLSEFEGCPNTVMEAMACACPLIVSAIPAHREILDNNAAILVDPRRVDQSAEAILAVLNSPDLAKARVLRAKRVSQGWSVSAMSENYLRIYEQLT